MRRSPAPCLRCGDAPGLFANRCKSCALADRAPSAERKTVAAEHNAAGRLRAEINAAGEAFCSRCLVLFCAASLEIDHTVPLSAGGTDTDSNVRPLCVSCHRTKTRGEQSLVQ